MNDDDQITESGVERSLAKSQEEDGFLPGSLKGADCARLEEDGTRQLCRVTLDELPGQPPACAATIGVTATIDPDSDEVLYRAPPPSESPPKLSEDCRP